MKARGSLSRLAHRSVRPLLLLMIVIGSLAAVSATDLRRITLTKIGEYRTGTFAEGGSEIVAYDAATRRLFSINAANTTVDIIDLSDPTQPALISTIDATAYGAGANSVAVDRGRVAVAIQADPKTDPGKVVFFDADGQYLAEVTVGALPDMVTFSRRGNFVLVANEGEPNDDYSIDPEGTVSIIRVGPTLARLDQSDVTTVDFTNFNDATLDPSIRIFGPGATVAQDLEPEYIAPADNERWAYVTLQENNAMAIIDVRRGTVKELVGLGFKDHMAAGNGIDASDRDGAISIANWPVYGMFQPDGIAAYRSNRGLMLITANEGDARDYDGFAEEERVKDLTLDATAFPTAAALQADEAIGRLTVTSANGLKPGTDTYEALYAFGGRSFSIWDRRGNLMFDSGDMLEQISADAYPDDFNATNDENDTFDNRSDNKGPEPEGVVVGNVGRGTYAFVGLERIGGVAVFEVSRPRQPQFIQYINSRDFAGDPELDTAGDLGPEGLTFIHQRQSPTGRPLLVVGNEVSGSIAIFEIAQP